MNSWPPYRTAAVISFVILLIYIVTLAPTVTFWDAGEFLTAARTLGIPHPPGTPLYVLLANVWGRLVPFGAYAWRINLLSAVCTATAAGFWFLVASDIVARLHADVDADSRQTLSRLGGIAAALMSAFTYSTWQSATETEVYASAVLGIAVIAWIATRCRSARHAPVGARLLLMALYVLALAVGNHLMGMLVGPALVVALVVQSRMTPLPDASARSAEWARIAVVGTGWVLLLGIGLGNEALVLIGGLLLVASLGNTFRSRQIQFAVVSVLVIAAGVSTLLFLYLRAPQQPWLNSGNPSTWQGLLDVIRRAQYPPRTPFDDPTIMHGPGNPGRTLVMLGYQVANYVQYFDWQWASSFGDLSRASLIRLPITLVMITLGLRGAFAHRRGDRASFALLMTAWLFTGPILVLYMNFKPGPSIGWDRWLVLSNHEVRDRDYFFLASFVIWGLWVAFALVDLARTWIPRVPGKLRAAPAGILAIALVPLVLNYRAASRRDTADVTMARDFGVALLQSVPQNAILFTNGDNDTFPLWYLQQVEGLRPDVSVVCLAIAQTGWYVRQLRELYDLSPNEVARPPFRTPRDLVLDLGAHGSATIGRGAAVFPVDILVFEILRKNAGHRPVAWSITAVDALYGLAPHLVQRGMALVMDVGGADSTVLSGGAAGAPGGSQLDLPATRSLVDRWSFGALESAGSDGLDGNIRAVAATIATPMTQVAAALLSRGDTGAAVKYLRRAIRIADDSVAKVMIGRLGSAAAR